MRTNLIIGIVLFCVACAHKQNDQREYNPSVITEAEITASGAATAYDAVKKLRANFLVSRGRTSFNEAPAEPNVYVDEQYFGPLSALKSIPASQVSTIRMYRVWEVQSKYGRNNLGGVIAVYTRQ